MKIKNILDGFPISIFLSNHLKIEKIFLYFIFGP